MDVKNRTKYEASKAFISFAEVVKKAISKVSPTSPRHLFDVFKEIEGSHEFKMLGEIFSKAFGGKSTGAADSRLNNYFRRSGFYLDIAKGKSADFNSAFEGLWAAFNNRDVKKTIIRPINFVNFPDNAIDFGIFKIQELSKDELDNLFEQEVCRIFYPDAVIDTKKLALFYHIVEESIKPKNTEKLNLIELGVTWKDCSKVKRKFPDRTLQLLSLFDWGDASSRHTPDDKETDFWFIPLDLPLDHTISNDLIAWPKASPDLSGLEMCTYYTPDGKETDKECPYFPVYLSNSQVAKLREVIANAYGFLKDIDLNECGWEFLEVSMGSLAKAFLSDGVEQLLWNVVALESLIGERQETTQTIRRRTGLIWGEGDKKKINKIRKEVDEIYAFRSALVHGRAKFGDGKKDFLRYHLRLARDYARKTVLWFLHYLSNIHRELQKGSIPLSNYPKQKELLLLLDYQIKSFRHKGVEVIMAYDFSAL